LRTIGVQFKPSLDLKHPGVKKVFKLMLPVVLGLSLPGVYSLIMDSFGSYYHEAVISYLDYANKLMQAPLGIFGQSLAIAVFPALTQFYAQKRMDMYREQLSKTMRTVLYLTVPISVLMFVMAPQVVGTMLEHGKFDAADRAATANCLRMFAIGIPAWCLHPVLMRGFFAIQNTVTPIVLGTLTTGLFIALIFALRVLDIGYLALPLAGSISAIVLVISLAFAVAPKIGGLDVKGLGITALKSLVGTLGLGLLAGMVAYTAIADRIAGHKLPTILAAGGVFLIGGWIYYFITKWLGMPESQYVARAMNRRAKRSEPVTPIESDGGPE
jgi:putative peptidoglycan lipid II flippase